MAKAPKAFRPPVPLEDDEQSVVIRYLEFRRNQFGERLRWHHSPNGEVRQKRVNRQGRVFCLAGQRLKEQGTSPGFPDLIVVLDKYPSEERPLHVAIEMKRANGRPSDVTDDQKGWLLFLSSCGWSARACFGAQEAINFLRQCGI